MVTAVEAILQEPKAIAVNVKWRHDKRGYRLEATVLAIETRQPLRIIGYVGPKNRSFALLFNNLPIRKYTVRDRHKDPRTGEVITGPHKHGWDDSWADKVAYVPDGIRAGDPNQEFIDFLKECKIEMRGTYSELVYQSSMFSI